MFHLRKKLIIAAIVVTLFLPRYATPDYSSSSSSIESDDDDDEQQHWDNEDEYESEDYDGEEEDEEEEEDEDHHYFLKPEDCFDKHTQCHLWANGGECESNPKYMLNNCPASCEICSPSCVDRNRNCELWAAEGECILDKGYMAINCPKACLFCVDESDAEPEHMKRRASIFLSMNLGINQKISGTVATQERIKEVIKQMDSYAKFEVTRRCYDKVRLFCKNDNEMCAFWSATGECERNPTFMGVSCSLACRLCDKFEGFRPCREFVKVGRRTGVYRERTLGDKMRSLSK